MFPRAGTRCREVLLLRASPLQSAGLKEEGGGGRRRLWVSQAETTDTRRARVCTLTPGRKCVAPHGTEKTTKSILIDF